MQQQQEFRAGSLPRSVRKESTSFEHSEPLPGNLTRWPLDGAGSGSGTGSGSRRPGESFVELTVTLQRHDSGFGFRIVGGTEEGSQVSFLSLLAKNFKKSMPKKLVKLLRKKFFRETAVLHFTNYFQYLHLRFQLVISFLEERPT